MSTEQQNASLKALTVKWLSFYNKHKLTAKQKKELKAIISTMEETVDNIDDRDFLLFIVYPIIEWMKVEHDKRTRNRLVEVFFRFDNFISKNERLKSLFCERLQNVCEDIITDNLLKRCWKDSNISTARVGLNDFLEVMQITHLKNVS